MCDGLPHARARRETPERMTGPEAVLPALPSPPADRSFELRGRPELLRLLLETAAAELRDAGFAEVLHLVPRGAGCSPPSGLSGAEVLEFATGERHVSISLAPDIGVAGGGAVLHVDGSGFGDDFDPLVDRVLRGSLRRLFTELSAPGPGAGSSGTHSRIARLARLLD